MGFISSFAKAKTANLPSINAGRNLWNETFGATSKEDQNKFPRVRPGGSPARSMIAEPAAYKRLLQAMRSMAPGGWSDDRWEQQKHFTDIRYICIHRTGEQLMQAEFQVFERDERHPDGKIPVRRGHPGWKLVELLEKPNNDDTFGDYMYSANLQMDLTGQHLTWMIPNALGVPMELYTVPTAIAIPQPAINPDYPDGYYRIQPIYPYGPFSSYPTPSTAVGAPIPAQWMLKIKYIHPLLRYDGYSPQTGLRLELDSVEQMNRSRWYTMKRIINPSAVLNFEEMEGAQPLPETEIDRIKAEFENEMQGPEASGRLYVATPGAKLEPWQTELRDLQYTEGWDQLVSFAMAGLGISKESAGMVGSTAYAVLYAAIKQLHLLTLVPKCNRIAAKLTRHLAPFFGDDLIIEIRPPRIDDHEVTDAKVNTAIAARCITKNEVRKELGMALTKELWGNDIAGEAEAAALNPDGTPAGKVSGVPNARDVEKEDGEDEQRTKVTSTINGSPLANGRKKPEARVEASEIARDRPKTGKLGRGALGSRKSLNGAHKSLGLADALDSVAIEDAAASGGAVVLQPINNIVVNVPRQRQPVVRVDVPKQETPIVHVKVPPPRLTQKSFTYDELGRPHTINEKEV